MTAGDDDWLAVIGNLGKARKSWGGLSRVLGREGADPKVSGSFYTAIAQAVLHFGSETWVIIQRMETTLDSFQSGVSRRLTSKQTRRKKNGRWDYLPLAVALGKAGIDRIRKSITWRQNMVTQYILTRRILDLCKRATRRPGARMSWRWWEQAGINLEGAKKRAAESTTRLEMDTESEEELDREPNGVAGGEEESQGESGSSGAEWSGEE